MSMCHHVKPLLAGGVLLGHLAAPAQTYTWSTIAGLAGSSGTNDGVGNAARFYQPVGVTVDVSSNVYVADYGNGLIRKLTPTGTNWAVVTIAGNAAHKTYDSDGNNSSAWFESPSGIAADTATPPNLYVTDQNPAVRQMVETSPGVWKVTTISSTSGVGQYYPLGPFGVCVNRSGQVFVSEAQGNTVDLMSFQGPNWTGAVILGIRGALYNGSSDGTNAAARFAGPQGIGVDAAGNVYVADTGNHTIRKAVLLLNSTNWVTSTLAGQVGVAGYADGDNTSAVFNAPDGLAVDTAGNLYVADANNNLIRKLTTQGTNGMVTTIGGLSSRGYGTADGVGSNAAFYHPAGVAVDSLGRVFVADYLNNTVRMGTPSALTNAVPALQIASSGGSVFVLWPVSAAGYSLQASTNANTGPWVTLANGITTNVVFTGPLTNGQMFYRLQ